MPTASEWFVSAVSKKEVCPSQNPEKLPVFVIFRAEKVGKIALDQARPVDTEECDTGAVDFGDLPRAA